MPRLSLDTEGASVIWLHVMAPLYAIPSGGVGAKPTEASHAQSEHELHSIVSFMGTYDAPSVTGQEKAAPKDGS